MKKKVIFQLVDTLNLGGTERMSVNLANTFHEQGWESHLIVSRKTGALDLFISEGVQIHFLEKNSFKDLSAFRKLYRLAKSYKPDYVHAHSTSVYWAVLLKILLGSFLLIWHDHFGLSDQLDKNKRSEMRFLSRWIDSIIVVNQKLLDFWQKHIPRKSNRIVFLPNFPHLQLVESIQKFEYFTFLNLANYRPQKDQLTLIEAAKLLADSGFDFRVLLVGQQVDVRWEQLIRKRIVELQLESKVKVYGPSDNVADLLGRSHSGVLSSESEGLPVSLLEYGLAALPVISTRVGQCPEVLGNGNFGILVPLQDPQAMANAMQDLLENPDRAFEMGGLFQKHVKNNYGSSQFMRGYNEILNVLTSEKLSSN